MGQPGPDRVLAAGDWDTNTTRAVAVIQSAGMRGIDTVLQCGDFGFWTPGPATNQHLDSIEATCERFDVTLLWVDGNHECFPALYALPIDTDTGLRPVRPHIYHLPRGYRWTWHGRTWMALGGAHSLDRHARTEGRSWWPEEFLSDADMERATTGGPVDVIVAHDCPDRVDIPGLAPPGFYPAAQLADAEAHRNLVGKVVDATRPGVLLHGHYHVRHNAVRPLANRASTAVIGLADDTADPRDNMLLLDLTKDELFSFAN